MKRRNKADDYSDKTITEDFTDGLSDSFEISEGQARRKRGRADAKVIITLLLVLLLLVAIGSATLAKYVRDIRAQDSARAANFTFTVQDQAGGEYKTEGTVIKIFETADTGVQDVGGDRLLIAPGTTGSFTVNVANTSEVKVDDSFALNLTNEDNIPVYFTFDGANYASFFTAENAATAISGVTLDGSIQDMAEAISAANTSLAAVTGTATYTINWTWAFTSDGSVQTDETDTALGTDGTALLQLEIQAVITQLDE